MVLKGSRDQAGGYDCSRERVRTMYGNVYTQHKYNFRLVEYGCILYTCVVSVLSGLCVGLGGSRAVEKM